MNRLGIQRMIKIWPFFCKTVKKKLFLPESEVVDSIIMSLSVFSPPVSISSLLGMAGEQFKPRPQQFDEFFSLFFCFFLPFSSFLMQISHFSTAVERMLLKIFVKLQSSQFVNHFPPKFLWKRQFMEVFRV